jgi:hypothetical protein
MALYKTLVKLVATYASEAWTLAEGDERALGLSRTISLGLYNDPDIAEYIKIDRTLLADMA